MTVEIRHEPASFLGEYARVPIAFTVSEVLEVTSGPGDHPELIVKPAARPYVKDYDRISETPTEWARHFDVSNWAFFAAYADGLLVGGATLACRTAGLHMLEGRPDLAVLWDIRVAPSTRRSGVGSALFGAASQWATINGFRHLKVETQNNNVPACRFYARHGCVLCAAQSGVYPELPAEVQLLWYKETHRVHLAEHR